MSIAVLQTEIRQHQAEQQSASWKAYQGLLRQLADGQKAPPADEITAILESAGRTIDDIPTDLDTLKQRDTIRARLAKADEVRPKLLEAEAELRHLKQQRDDLANELNARIAIAADAVDAIRRIVSAGDADTVGRELRDSCRDPGLRSRLDAVDDELRSRFATLSSHRFMHERNGTHADDIAAVERDIRTLEAEQQTIYRAMESQ
jgi:uncharacterized coiled-coil DUF342 family protein